MSSSALLRLCALSGLALAGSPVLAADIPDYGYGAAPAATGYPATWSGPYLGVSLGGGVGNHDATYSAGGAPVAGVDGIGGEGFVIDGTIGYDAQVGGNFVVGVLGDIYWSNLGSDAFAISGGTRVDGDIDAKWGFDLLARAGIAVNPSTLLYALGGYSWEKFEASFVATPGGAAGSQEESFGGWTLGAGIETKLTDNVSVKAEYRYTRFDDADYGVPGGGSINIEPSTHTARFGINYRFGPALGF
ncbi:outer membrane protein [Propylenella binzhouense]|uniref:Porin family protein n=1 Tax=Propylenella binzhouense TaxID=2555902 RepID=A0A964T732_9HYPH|nr:outer membrane beta-barrel protein [Propylenella binzhouense]MYZ49751.1 porin family protein [Propylenella binzhouense]